MLNIVFVMVSKCVFNIQGIYKLGNELCGKPKYVPSHSLSRDVMIRCLVAVLVIGEVGIIISSFFCCYLIAEACIVW